MWKFLGLFFIFERANKKMIPTPEHNERIAKITFASVYPHYVTKVEKKNHTKEELHEVITWLTGFDETTILVRHFCVTAYVAPVRLAFVACRIVLDNRWKHKFQG